MEKRNNNFSAQVKNILVWWDYNNGFFEDWVIVWNSSFCRLDTIITYSKHTAWLVIFLSIGVLRKAPCHQDWCCAGDERVSHSDEVLCTHSALVNNGSVTSRLENPLVMTEPKSPNALGPLVPIKQDSRTLKSRF